MKIRSEPFGSSLSRVELAIAFAPERGSPDLGPALADAVERCKNTGDVTGAPRSFALFHRPDGARSEPKRLGFVGIGKPKEMTSESLRRAAAVAQARAEDAGVASFELLVTEADHGEVGAFDAGLAVAEGIALGAYRYEPPRKEKPKPRKAQAAAVRYAGTRAADFDKGLKLGVLTAAATVFARDIENLPGNIANPARLAQEAKKLGGAKIAVKVLEKRDMERLKMGALLGVARGSAEAPKLILLDYAPAGAKRTVCVVGKGLTFDSGGISIKPSAKMDEMRYDMCGAGAVLGLFHAIGKGALAGARGRTRIIGIVAAAENMPDAAAQKPGDVVRAMDGTTIEVLNTDAEGRLVLADALAYAVKEYAPERIVDLATLTGAVIVALGHEAAGIMGNDQGARRRSRRRGSRGRRAAVAAAAVGRAQGADEEPVRGPREHQRSAARQRHDRRRGVPVVLRR
ncbi:MAG: leucyl aminopeptidase [Planctomycetes bacterium]|nr:leucyl aminopeptidase [Planctomycetota bacterium]